MLKNDDVTIDNDELTPNVSGVTHSLGGAITREVNCDSTFFLLASGCSRSRTEVGMHFDGFNAGRDGGGITCAQVEALFPPNYIAILNDLHGH